MIKTRHSKLTNYGKLIVLGLHETAWILESDEFNYRDFDDFFNIIVTIEIIIKK